MKDKIIYFWLACCYVKKNLVCPPPGGSDTALSAVWGALARSQDAVCTAPAAAAATAAGCRLLLAPLRPPPGSGGNGCCIRSGLAPHRHLACQSNRESGAAASAGEGRRARELGTCGARVGGEAPCAQPPRPPGATEAAEQERAGSRTWPGTGRGAGGGISGAAERARQSDITTGRATNRGAGGGARRPGQRPGAVAEAGGGPERGLAQGAEGGGGRYYNTALARRGRSRALQVRSGRGAGVRPTFRPLVRAGGT